MKTLTVSWSNYDSSVFNLAEKIRKYIFDNGIELSSIGLLGLSRGGLVPLGILSHSLHTKMTFSLKINSYNSDRVRGKVVMDKVGCDEIIRNFNGKVLFVIDDLIDTGYTMKTVVDRLNSVRMDIQIVSSVVYDKIKICDNCDGNKIYQADLIGTHIPDMWVEFPYEKPRTSSLQRILDVLNSDIF